MTKVVQVRNNIDWMRGTVISQKGANLENIWPVELRGFTNV